MSFYVDVHTHLTHEAFDQDCMEVIERALKMGLGAIVVNGLTKKSNRQTLALAKKFPLIKPALGIYPLEAVNEQIPPDFHLKIERFSIKEELDFIEKIAEKKQMIAIGECGLDGHHLGEDTFLKQEQVFISLIDIANKNGLPIIVHSRKREKRVLEILAAYGVKKVNLHCYSGKMNIAIQAAEKWGWCFSIPANIGRSHSFQALSQKLPPECILTETDAPYLSPEAEGRNEPANVTKTIPVISRLRAWEDEQTITTIWNNYLRLFS